MPIVLNTIEKRPRNFQLFIIEITWIYSYKSRRWQKNKLESYGYTRIRFFSSVNKFILFSLWICHNLFFTKATSKKFFSCLLVRICYKTTNYWTVVCQDCASLGRDPCSHATKNSCNLQRKKNGQTFAGPRQTLRKWTYLN